MSLLPFVAQVIARERQEIALCQAEQARQFGQENTEESAPPRGARGIKPGDSLASILAAWLDSRRPKEKAGILRVRGE